MTGRAAILIVVVAVLVVSYASSLRAYLEQRSTMNSLQRQIASSEAAIKRLKTDKARWNDPAYIQEQARLRFGWVMPGETAYQVLGRDGKPLSGSTALSDPSSIVHNQPTAWWQKAYSSLQAADHPATTPTPAKKITKKAQ